MRSTTIKRSLAGGLVIAAAILPAAAQAQPIQSPGLPSAAPVIPAAPTAASHSPFQWADAGIGAGGAVVLLGTGALATSAIRRRAISRPATH